MQPLRVMENTFHQKREAIFSQSWEAGTCLCPEKQIHWVKRMLGLQLF